MTDETFPRFIRVPRQRLTAKFLRGSVVSRVPVADGSSNYEVQATVHVVLPIDFNTEYAVLARSNADGSTAYKFAW